MTTNCLQNYLYCPNNCRDDSLAREKLCTLCKIQLGCFFNNRSLW